jgi:hypothetical protein
MRKSITLILCGLVLSANVLAQFTQPDIIPPSPEAASLGKFAEVPVSYNTGTPQIEIPLYQISVNDMQIPIGLSYHASGIKVEEVASWVGIGFALNAGGAITRVMQGRPDESSNGYFNKYQWDKWQDMQNWIVPELKLGVYDERHQFQMAVAEGRFDLQPDIFYFNFAGYSGRIVFDVDKKPVIIPYQDLKISHPFSGLTEWVISTPEGIEYIFKNDDAEWTTPMNEGVNQSAFHSTWYLSEVRSLKQPGFIKFNYVPEFLMGIETTPTTGVVLGKLDNSDEKCSKDPGYAQGMATNQYSIKIRYLDNIQFTNGSIKFNSTADRQDKYQNVTYAGRKLNSMVVTSGYDFIKTVDFTYSYATNRLTLDNLKESGKSAYKFQYNGSLPPSTSFAQDHWGYYNGNDGNKSLIPPMTNGEKAYYRTSIDYLTFANADRSATEFSKAGTLSTITYPTGGKRQFTFESHQIYGTTTAQRGGSVSARGATLNPSMDSYEQAQYNYYKSDYVIAGGPLNVQAMPFTIDVATAVEFSFFINNSNAGAVADVAEAIVYKVPFTYGNPLYYNLAGVKTLELGDYVMIVSASQSGVTVTGGISYSETVVKNSLVGGIRVSKINDYDNGKLTSSLEFKYVIEPLSTSTGPVNPNPPIKKPLELNPDYEGEIPVPAELPSTGKLFYPPGYKSTTPCQRLHISARNVSKVGTHEGYHMGYDRVEVIQKYFKKGDEVVDVIEDETFIAPSIGSTIYLFNNNINDIMRNQLRETIFLSDRRQLVKHIINNYSNETFSSYAPSIEMKRSLHVTDDGCFFGTDSNGDPIPCHTIDYYEFSVTQKRYATFFAYQSGATERIYSKVKYPEYLETSKFIKQGKEVVGLPQSSHTLPTEIVQVSSTGDKIIERFINSPDEGNPGTPDIKVPLKHYIIKETNGQQTLLKATLTQYAGNLPTSVQMYESKRPVPYAEGMEIAYGKKIVNIYSNQKVVERYFSDGVKTAYIWDTKLVNPISEIKNCSSGQAAYTSFENSSGEGNWSFTLNTNSDFKTGRQCHSFTTSSISKNQLLTNISYKVAYWAKNGIPVVSNVITSNDDALATSDGWKYYEKTISGTTSVTLSAAVGTLIDELRIYPVGAFMTSLTYKNEVGISTKVDANNKFSFYEYDVAGRLIFIRDSNKKPLQNFDYHFKN